MNSPLPEIATDVLVERCGALGCITLNRPRALNALSLPMIRVLTATLRQWADDPAVRAVAIRGSNKHGPFGAFCAGGDIRFFHEAALSGDPQLEDFFTEEYALNHLIHRYAKPYIAFMDGVVMGGGMGISQGAAWRLVTTRTRMAMPETNIGLFPDVGGGYFLSRCPGHAGEWLALTGATLGAADALRLGLADHCVDAERLDAAWAALASLAAYDQPTLAAWVAMFSVAPPADAAGAAVEIDQYFGHATVSHIIAALEASTDAWTRASATQLRQRSPLMLHVVLEQIRRGRSLGLADDLRMERDLVRHCFAPRNLGRNAAQSETVEGIRALAVDKDNAPRWNPPRIEDVTPDMVTPFFVSPWHAEAHPLRALD